MMDWRQIGVTAIIGVLAFVGGGLIDVIEFAGEERGRTEVGTAYVEGLEGRIARLEDVFVNCPP